MTQKPGSGDMDVDVEAINNCEENVIKPFIVFFLCCPVYLSFLPSLWFFRKSCRKKRAHIQNILVVKLTGQYLAQKCQH